MKHSLIPASALEHIYRQTKGLEVGVYRLIETDGQVANGLIKWRKPCTGSSASSGWLERNKKTPPQPDSPSLVLLSRHSNGFFFPSSSLRPLTSIDTERHQRWAKHLGIFPSYPLPPFPHLEGAEWRGRASSLVQPTTTPVSRRVFMSFALAQPKDNRNKQNGQRVIFFSFLRLMSTSGALYLVSALKQLRSLDL